MAHQLRDLALDRRLLAGPLAGDGLLDGGTQRTQLLLRLLLEPVQGAYLLCDRSWG